MTSVHSLLQYAAEDTIQRRLTENPTDTYFRQGKENFSRYLIESAILGPQSSNGFDNTYKFKIHGMADFLINTCLKIKLPSLKDYDNFAWVNKIGYYLIEKAEFKIGGTVISEINGKYLDLHSEAFENQSEKIRNDILIGNTVDLLIPKNYNPSDPNYLSRTYGYYKDKDASGNVSAGVGDGPGETTLYVDLKFYFSRSTSLAFPLAKLGSKNHIEIHIKIAPLEKLLRKFDTTASSGKVTLSEAMKNNLNSKLTQNEVDLLADMAFVTDEEKKLLFYTEEFPIIQTVQTKHEIDPNENEPDITLEYSQNNIQEILFAIQRNDIIENNDQSHTNLYNDHTNYTSNFSKSVLPNATNLLLNRLGNYNKGPRFLDDNKEFIKSSELYFGNGTLRRVSGTITNLINPGRFNALASIGIHYYPFTLDRNIIGNSLYTGQSLTKKIRLSLENNSQKTILYAFVNTLAIMKITNNGDIMIKT